MAKKKKITISTVSAPNKILFMSIWNLWVSESPWSPEGFPFPPQCFCGWQCHIAALSNSISSLDFCTKLLLPGVFSFSTHKAPHVISVMFGRLLPFHPSKCSTYSIFTPEPLSTRAVSLETRDLYCQRNRNAKASCKIYAGTCKEQTKGAHNVLCKHFSFKENARYFIYHPRQARERILEKSSARGMDLWHCKRSW